MKKFTKKRKAISVFPHRKIQIRAQMYARILNIFQILLKKVFQWFSAPARELQNGLKCVGVGAKKKDLYSREKAKIANAFLGTEFLQFLAAVAILH